VRIIMKNVLKLILIVSIVVVAYNTLGEMSRYFLVNQVNLLKAGALEMRLYRAFSTTQAILQVVLIVIGITHIIEALKELFDAIKEKCNKGGCNSDSSSDYDRVHTEKRDS